jgi:hypothetical protein
MKKATLIVIQVETENSRNSKQILRKLIVNLSAKIMMTA